MSCGSRESSRHEIEDQKYSENALSVSTQRVEQWESNDLLSISPDLYEVHISPQLWNNVDVAGKKEIMSTVMIYMEGVKGYDFNFIDFKDKINDREIGYWSSISGFEIKN